MGVGRVSNFVSDMEAYAWTPDEPKIDPLTTLVHAIWHLRYLQAATEDDLAAIKILQQLNGQVYEELRLKHYWPGLSDEEIRVRMTSC